jgi:hypothetical protein
MEQNLLETTSWWKTYGKQLNSEDLEVRDVRESKWLFAFLGRLLWIQLTFGFFETFLGCKYEW